MHGAAGATRPLISTIIKPNKEGFVESCLIRNEYIRSETPQAFLFDIIFNAYEKVRITFDHIKNLTFLKY